MAAPTPTARETPTGLKLKDGFSSLVTITSLPNISLWEVSAKPPGLDGGDAINTTTMHNTTYRTMAPRALKTLTESTFKAAYDPGVISTLVGLINVETTFTQDFADGSTWAYYGYLKAFEPDELVEGTMPLATVTVVPTNWDPSGQVEAGPAVVSVTGS